MSGLTIPPVTNTTLKTVSDSRNQVVSGNQGANLKAVIAEYVFIDGFNTTRSKTRIVTGRLFPGQEDRGLVFNVDVWNTDGSSTGQSQTKKSDIILAPRAMFNDPFNISTPEYKYILVLCDVLNPDGTPHSSNNRTKLFNVLSQIGEEQLKKEDPWFGIEQEYLILDAKTNTPFGGYEWIPGKPTSEQGPFYCSAGGNVCFGREIAMEHMNACIAAGIAICGVNAEVAPAQWEFQIGICNPVVMGDHLWMARYILARVAEKHGAYISYDPKPLGTQWNGSGAHTNFSISRTRQSQSGMEEIHKIIKKLEGRHREHMVVYGDGNERRLTGIHETSNIGHFSYGDCDRGSSVRVPVNVLADGCGYLEDRRPASNADPYLVCTAILETVFL